MPSASLHPHPSTPVVSAHELSVQLDWHDALCLHYRLRGPLATLLIPPRATPTRTDELWRHTCFELFVTAPGLAGYCEFNFSPSGQWAAYRFDGYRNGMQPLTSDTPAIRASISTAQLDVHVELAIGAVPMLAGLQELSCGLTAVLETTTGERSYWALNHGTAQPDFHHSSGFVLRLMSAPGR